MAAAHNPLAMVSSPKVARRQVTGARLHSSMGANRRRARGPPGMVLRATVVRRPNSMGDRRRGMAKARPRGTGSLRRSRGRVSRAGDLSRAKAGGRGRLRSTNSRVGARRRRNHRRLRMCRRPLEDSRRSKADGGAHQGSSPGILGPGRSGRCMPGRATRRVHPQGRSHGIRRPALGRRRPVGSLGIRRPALGRRRQVGSLGTRRPALGRRRPVGSLGTHRRGPSSGRRKGNPGIRRPGPGSRRRKGSRGILKLAPLRQRSRHQPREATPALGVRANRSRRPPPATTLRRTRAKPGRRRARRVRHRRARRVSHRRARRLSHRQARRVSHRPKRQVSHSSTPPRMRSARRWPKARGARSQWLPAGVGWSTPDGRSTVLPRKRLQRSSSPRTWHRFGRSDPVAKAQARRPGPPGPGGTRMVRGVHQVALRPSCRSSTRALERTASHPARPPRRPTHPPLRPTLRRRIQGRPHQPRRPVSTGTALRCPVHRRATTVRVRPRQATTPLPALQRVTARRRSRHPRVTRTLALPKATAHLVASRRTKRATTRRPERLNRRATTRRPERLNRRATTRRPERLSRRATTRRPERPSRRATRRRLPRRPQGGPTHSAGRPCFPRRNMMPPRATTRRSHRPPDTRATPSRRGRGAPGWTLATGDRRRQAITLARRVTVAHRPVSRSSRGRTRDNRPRPARLAPSHRRSTRDRPRHRRARAHRRSDSRRPR